MSLLDEWVKKYGANTWKQDKAITSKTENNKRHYELMEDFEKFCESRLAEEKKKEYIKHRKINAEIVEKVIRDNTLLSNKNIKKEIKDAFARGRLEAGKEIFKSLKKGIIKTRMGNKAVCVGRIDYIKECFLSESKESKGKKND